MDRRKEPRARSTMRLTRRAERYPRPRERSDGGRRALGGDVEQADRPDLEGCADCCDRDKAEQGGRTDGGGRVGDSMRHRERVAVVFVMGGAGSVPARGDHPAPILLGGGGPIPVLVVLVHQLAVHAACVLHEDEVRRRAKLEDDDPQNKEQAHDSTAAARAPDMAPPQRGSYRGAWASHRGPRPYHAGPPIDKLFRGKRAHSLRIRAHLDVFGAQRTDVRFRAENADLDPSPCE